MHLRAWSASLFLQAVCIHMFQKEISVGFNNSALAIQVTRKNFHFELLSLQNL